MVSKSSKVKFTKSTFSVGQHSLKEIFAVKKLKIIIPCFAFLQAESAAVVKSSTKMMPEYSEKFLQERDICTTQFEKWTEYEQIAFVEHLLSRMCHYQHGQINAYLRPMLQRDFITALPGKEKHFHITYCGPECTRG